ITPNFPGFFGGWFSKCSTTSFLFTNLCIILLLFHLYSRIFHYSTHVPHTHTDYVHTLIHRNLLLILYAISTKSTNTLIRSLLTDITPIHYASILPTQLMQPF